ncbi:MAG: hypothetical protein JWO69_455 [Thermoleophilia bacterium]|jgi:hypothetical protein|nr:hypothetical protein [Thermoleophilia bacterium]
MPGDSPRIDFLLARLVEHAMDLQQALGAKDWDAAEPIQDDFDANFEQLQRMVECDSVSFQPRHTNELSRLRELHAENERLLHALKLETGTELQRTVTVGRIGAYAPLGANHQPRPRYVDDAA